jgi:hypothetical protein
MSKKTGISSPFSEENSGKSFEISYVGLVSSKVWN